MDEDKAAFDIITHNKNLKTPHNLQLLSHSRQNPILAKQGETSLCNEKVPSGTFEANQRCFDARGVPKRTWALTMKKQRNISRIMTNLIYAQDKSLIDGCGFWADDAWFTWA